MKNKIEVLGSRVHNLKNVDVTIPRNSLVHGLVGLWKEFASFRYHLCRGAAEIHRNFLGLRPEFPRKHGTSGCRQNHRSVARYIHRTKDNKQKPALNRWNNNGDIRLFTTALCTRR